MRTVTSAGDGFQGAFGIGIATRAAVVAGIASLPTPITEIDDENWLYHTFISLHPHTGTEAEWVGSESEMIIEIDSKAMRKFPDGTQIYAALEVVEIGTAAMDVFFDSRMLFKLS